MAVHQALMEIPGVRPHYQIIIEDRDGVKDVRINVEAEPGVTGFTIEKHLKEVLGFSPRGDVFRPGALPRQEGKAQRVFFKTVPNGGPGGAWRRRENAAFQLSVADGNCAKALRNLGGPWFEHGTCWV